MTLRKKMKSHRSSSHEFKNYILFSGTITRIKKSVHKNTYFLLPLWFRKVTNSGIHASATLVEAWRVQEVTNFGFPLVDLVALIAFIPLHSPPSNYKVCRMYFSLSLWSRNNDFHFTDRSGVIQTLIHPTQLSTPSIWAAFWSWSSPSFYWLQRELSLTTLLTLALTDTSIT